MPFPPKQLQQYAASAAKKKPLQSFPGKGKDGAPFGKGSPKGPPKGKGNPGHDDGGDGHPDQHEDDQELVKQVAADIDAGHVDQDLMEKVKGYDPEKDGNPPDWAEDEATWDRAKKAVDPEGEGAQYDDPYAVVAHVYKKMGGGVK